jgi:NhaP-type Na+/H+ or K+/H+ antiporter
MFFGLVMGCIITFTLSRYAPNIPYSVVVFLLGIILGLWVKFTYLDAFGESLNLWSNIQPALLLFVFLPPLIFGDAMKINIHHLKSTFWSSALLAGPGSVIGVFLLAACVKVMLPYNWTWELCYTFGAILCATDPVAVVALLKDAGAAPRLTILVIQESLYNDGAALVLFNIFLDTLRIEKIYDYTASSSIKYLIRVIFISPALGVAIAFATLLGLNLANRRLNTDDVTIQVVLTLCCAYLSFFIAEYFVKVSGVLSCVFAGIKYNEINLFYIIKYFFLI